MLAAPQMAVAPRVPSVRRIAVLRANGLGDYLFAEPALASLKAAYPQAQLTLLGAPWHAEALEGRPGPVDSVVVVPEQPDAGWAAGLGERMPFDLAVQMHGGGRSSNPLVAALGARVAVGLATPEAPPLDRTLPYYYFQHEVVRFLEVAALAGAAPQRTSPSWIVTPRDRLRALDLLGTGGSEPLVVLAPGAGDGRRRWPHDSFAAVGDSLAEKGAMVVVTGSAAEAELVREVRARMRAPSVDAGGRTGVGALGAVLERAAVVIANDSGTLHLARAVGAPTVGIYWCGNLINAGPLVNARHRVALSWRLRCPECGADCMRKGCTHDASFVADVPMAEVRDAALALLATTRPHAPSLARG